MRSARRRGPWRSGAPPAGRRRGPRAAGGGDGSAAGRPPSAGTKEPASSCSEAASAAAAAAAPPSASSAARPARRAPATAARRRRPAAAVGEGRRVGRRCDVAPARRDRPRARARRPHVAAGRSPPDGRDRPLVGGGSAPAQTLAQLVALGSRLVEPAGRIGGRLPRRGQLLRRPLGPLTGPGGRPLQLLCPGGRLGGVGLGPCSGGLRPLHLGPQRRQLGALTTGLGLGRVDPPLERLGRALVGSRLGLLLDQRRQLALPARPGGATTATRPG